MTWQDKYGGGEGEDDDVSHFFNNKKKYQMLFQAGKNIEGVKYQGLLDNSHVQFYVGVTGKLGGPKITVMTKHLFPPPPFFLFFLF